MDEWSQKEAEKYQDIGCGGNRDHDKENQLAQSRSPFRQPTETQVV
jgi:hypothetical protein